MVKAAQKNDACRCGQQNHASLVVKNLWFSDIYTEQLSWKIKACFSASSSPFFALSIQPGLED